MRRDEATLILGAILSRCTGFARDAAFAWLLGNGAAADALAAALRLPFLARRLFGEGTLSLTLTTACGREACPARGAALARAVTRRLAGLVCMGVVLGVAFAPWSIALIAPGLGARPEVLEQAAGLFRITAPYLIFIALAAGRMAFLHSRQRFFLPSLAPAVFNVVTLAFAGAAGLAVATSGAACWLAVGVLAGGVCQWLIQCVGMDHPGQWGGGKEGVEPARVRTVLRRIPAGIFGAAMPQLAFLVAAGLASFLPGGHLAALFYAERLLEFPLGVLGAAVGMAAVPRLAALLRPTTDAPDAVGRTTGEKPDGQRADPGVAGGQSEASGHEYVPFVREMRRAVSLTLALNLPAAAGLAAVSAPLVALIFGRGAFTAEAVAMTALALCAYAPGLPAYALSRPLLAACHVLEDTATPARATVAGLGVMLAAGLVLVAPVGFGPACDGGEGSPLLCAGAIRAAGAVMRANVALVPPLAVSLGLWIYALLLWRGLSRTLRNRAGTAFSGFAPRRRDVFRESAGAACVLGAAGGLVRLCAEQGWPPACTLCLAVPAGMAVYAAVLGIGKRSLLSDLLSDIAEKRRSRSRPDSAR